MSVKTIARRYNVNSYSQQERDDLVNHLVGKTQPQRRIFLGKLDNFKDKEERRINQKMLRAYLKGNTVFYDGTRKQEIITVKKKFNKETGKHDEVRTNTGVFEDVPQGHIVKQMYFFN